MGITLSDVKRLRLEYSQFRLTGLERPGDDPSAPTYEPDALWLRHNQPSGYARVTVTTGTEAEGPGDDWYGHQTHLIKASSSIGIQTWDGGRVAQFHIAPGNYKMICAFRPATMTVELELTSLEEGVATSEQRIHFVPVDFDH